MEGDAVGSEGGTPQNTGGAANEGGAGAAPDAGTGAPPSNEGAPPPGNAGDQGGQAGTTDRIQELAAERERLAKENEDLKVRLSLNESVTDALAATVEGMQQAGGYGAQPPQQQTGATPPSAAAGAGEEDPFAGIDPTDPVALLGAFRAMAQGIQKSVPEAVMQAVDQRMAATQADQVLQRSVDAIQKSEDGKGAEALALAQPLIANKMLTERDLTVIGMGCKNSAHVLRKLATDPAALKEFRAMQGEAKGILVGRWDLEHEYTANGGAGRAPANPPIAGDGVPNPGAGSGGAQPSSSGMTDEERLRQREIAKGYRRA